MPFRLTEFAHGARVWTPLLLLLDPRADKQEAELLAIQKLLGHASLSTTLLYTHVRRDHLHTAAEVQGLLPLEQLCRPRAQPARRARRPRRSKSAK